jgi:hypothetical protein
MQSFIGLTASKAFNDWTIRSEVGYNTHSYHLLNNNSRPLSIITGFEDQRSCHQLSE